MDCIYTLWSRTRQDTRKALLNAVELAPGNGTILSVFANLVLFPAENGRILAVGPVVFASQHAGITSHGLVLFTHHEATVAVVPIAVAHDQVVTATARVTVSDDNVAPAIATMRLTPTIFDHQVASLQNKLLRIGFGRDALEHAIELFQCDEVASRVQCLFVVKARCRGKHAFVYCLDLVIELLLHQSL